MKTFSEKSINWNTLSVMLARITDILVGMAMMMLLTRYLGTSQYGEYVWIMALIMIFQPLLNFEMDKIMVREIASDRSQLQSAFGTLLSQKCLFTGSFCIFLILGIILLPFSSDQKTALLLVGLGECFFQFWLAYVALFRSLERMEYEFIFGLFFRTIHLGMIVTAILYDMGFTSIFGATLIADFFLFAISSFYVKHHFVRIRPHYHKDQFRYYLSESYPIFLSTLFLIGLLRLDVLILRLLTDSEQVSFFHVPHNIIAQFGIMPTALVTALLPVMSRVYKLNKQRFNELIVFSEKFTLTISVPIFLFLVFCSNELISFFAGNAYSESTINMIILSPGFTLLFFIFLFSNLLIATGDQRKIVSRTILAFCVNLVLDIILIPIFFSTGAAIAKVATYTVYSISLYLLVKQKRFNDHDSGYREYSVILLLSIGILFVLSHFFPIQKFFPPETEIWMVLVILVAKGVMILLVFSIIYSLITGKNFVIDIYTIVRQFSSFSQNDEMNSKSNKVLDYNG